MFQTIHGQRGGRFEDDEAYAYLNTFVMEIDTSKDIRKIAVKTRIDENGLKSFVGFKLFGEDGGAFKT